METKAEYIKRVTNEFENGRDPDDLELDENLDGADEYSDDAGDLS